MQDDPNRVDVRALLRGVDLATLVERDGVQLRGGKEKCGPCPRCGGTDRFHVRVHEGIGYFFCRQCHADVDGRLWHDAITYLQWTRGLDFKAAVEYLGGHTDQGDTLKSQRQTISAKPREVTPEVRALLHAAATHYQAELNAHEDARTYLKQRGVREETIARLRIGYASGVHLARALHQASLSLALAAQIGLLSGRGELLRDRIVFPVLDTPTSTERVDYLIGRAIHGGDRPKYLGLPDGPVHKRPLRGGRAERGLLVVEGPFDYTALVQWGLDAEFELVGLLGTAHPCLIDDLTRRPTHPRVLIALDQDRPGQDAALRLLSALVERSIRATILTWREAKDCGELLQQGDRGRNLFEHALAKAGA